jgi:hypothetical protein
MKKYKPYAKKYWYSFLLGPFFMVLEACGEFILPYINANIIDVGAANGDVPYIIKNGAFTEDEYSTVIENDKNASHVLDGKKIIFVGNSYTYYGRAVIVKSQKILTQQERS